MSFASNIRRERTKKGLSQAQAAKLIGVTIKNIQSYEYGNVYPQVARLKKIVDGFNVPKKDLYKFLFE